MESKTIRISAVALACALLLSACGGGGGGSSEPATPVTPATPAPTATADSYTLDWNAAKRLSVQDNDGNAGGATVEIVTAPKNGTATLDAGVIVYTPAAGFFGEDTLRYRLVRGDAKAEAEVKLSVEGLLHLEGSAGKMLPGAQVSATIGERTQTVTADAQGGFVFDLKTAKPTEFVALTATGTGAKSHVVYDSLLGEAGRLARLGTQGKLTSSELPGLHVGAFSAATAGLLARQGVLPTSDAQLRQGLARIGSRELIDTSALLLYVADGATPLPSGIATTRALVRDAAAFRGLELQQWRTSTSVLNKTRLSYADDATLRVAPPTPTDAPVTLVYGNGIGGGASGALRLTLQPGGKAIAEDTERRAASWSLRSDRTLSVVYDQPLVRKEASTTYTTTAIELRELASEGVTLFRTVGTLVDSAGAQANVVRDATTVWSGAARRLLGLAAPLQAGEFAVGKRWAGVLGRAYDDAVGGMQQDVLAITGANTGRLERAGTDVTWSFADGTLEVVIGTTTHRYRRVDADLSGGERWLVEQRTATGSSVIEALVVAADEVAREAAIGHVWETNLYWASSGGVERYALRADAYAALATIGWGTGEFTVRDLAFGYGWSLAADGRSIVLDPCYKKTGCFGAPVELKPVAKRGSTLFAITVDAGAGAQAALAVLTDRGEAK